MNTDPRGYYAALNLTPEATHADIRRAFRALIRLRHPDVGRSDGGLRSGTEDVHRILDAFAVLGDPLARTAYDSQGRAPDPVRTNRNGAAEQQLIPVRHHVVHDPVIRVSPVRWEKGP